MSDPVQLYCTYDEDAEEWFVYFDHPLGGIFLLESFNNEADARAFWQEQIDSADYGDEE